MNVLTQKVKHLSWQTFDVVSKSHLYCCICPGNSREAQHRKVSFDQSLVFPQISLSLDLNHLTVNDSMSGENCQPHKQNHCLETNTVPLSLPFNCKQEFRQNICQVHPSIAPSSLMMGVIFAKHLHVCFPHAEISSDANVLSSTSGFD